MHRVREVFVVSNCQRWDYITKGYNGQKNVDSTSKKKVIEHVQFIFTGSDLGCFLLLSI